jgi:hypothetical protein
MPKSRLLQSILHPGSANEWMADLWEGSRPLSLSSVHPTLFVRLEDGDGQALSRHELVFGLFRTVWQCKVDLDLSARRLFASGASQHFETFEQTLSWTETEAGVSIQSDLQWSGARSGLEDLLLRSLLRFPGWATIGTSERTTKRLATVEDQAAA